METNLSKEMRTTWFKLDDGWDDDDGDDNAGDDGDEAEKDRNEWMGVVQWMDAPFSAPGDSGSLVFALEDGVTVPLGIHVGAPEAIPDIAFLLVLTRIVMKRTKRGGSCALLNHFFETYCHEAEDKEGWYRRSFALLNDFFKKKILITISTKGIQGQNSKGSVAISHIFPASFLPMWLQ
jgi:hypothetical protein